MLIDSFKKNIEWVGMKENSAGWDFEQNFLVLLCFSAIAV